MAQRVKYLSQKQADISSDIVHTHTHTHTRMHIHVRTSMYTHKIKKKPGRINPIPNAQS